MIDFIDENTNDLIFKLHFCIMMIVVTVIGSIFIYI